jgi:hypothetical protein
MIVLKDINEYESELQAILTLSVDRLQESFKSNDQLLKLSGILFEREVCRTLNEFSVGYSFHNKFEQASTLAFPDLYVKILENKWFGVEVKTSQGDWKCFGNSIFESTRLPNLDDRIFVFFGKFSPSKLECRWAKYDECIDNINITHSPRYQINMDIKDDPSLSVFSKMKITYLDFYKSDISERMEYVRKFKRQGIGQDIALWWLPDHETPNVNDEEKLLIKLLSSLSNHKKAEIRYSAIALFPEIFSKNQNKYSNLLVWLASRYGVVTGNLRDLFSAGGQYDIHFNGLNYRIPKICKHLQLDRDNVIKIITSSDKDELASKWNLDINLIPEKSGERVSLWIGEVVSYLKQQPTMPVEFPLLKWLTSIYLRKQ